jgi:peptidoglycan hydrolase-like protein with peptidoglycan-binding domain
MGGQLNPATVVTLGLDPAELLTLDQAQTGASTPQPLVGEPLNPDVVRRIQVKLRQLGFYPGAVDGVWGANTQAATERLQQSRGLQATGQLNPATVAAMGLDPNNLMAETRMPPAALSGSSSPRR